MRRGLRAYENDGKFCNMVRQHGNHVHMSDTTTCCVLCQFSVICSLYVTVWCSICSSYVTVWCSIYSSYVTLWYYISVLCVIV